MLELLERQGHHILRYAGTSGEARSSHLTLCWNFWWGKVITSLPIMKVLNLFRFAWRWYALPYEYSFRWTNTLSVKSVDYVNIIFYKSTAVQSCCIKSGVFSIRHEWNFLKVDTLTQAYAFKMCWHFVLNNSNFLHSWSILTLSAIFYHVLGPGYVSQWNNYLLCEIPMIDSRLQFFSSPVWSDRL
jgi:hypothetical protein